MWLAAWQIRQVTPSFAIPVSGAPSAETRPESRLTGSWQPAQKRVDSIPVQAYRVAHWLWTTGRRDLAYFFQMRVSEEFSIDIHPAARIGKGIMIDHAHAIVIGETAVVGDNVSMLHSVTLGGTGKEDEDRHPKIGDGVLIGAGAKVLGNIRIGNCARIAAGSVVLTEVPPRKTVAGVPARIVGEAGCAQPAITMDHILKSGA